MKNGSSDRQATVPVADTQNPSLPSALAVRWLFPLPAGAVTALSERPLVLGRDEEADVRLEGKETSRRHADIRREGPVTILRDLSSLNGTFVDGARITEAPLAAGSLIRLGEWIGLVIQAPAAADAAGAAYAAFAPGLYGGPGLAPALDTARRVAASTLPIVIEGETGTGKEGFARALHTWSGRRGAFIAVNCGALPEALAEGELFGYRKGAFTGADRPHAGYFRSADRGTLLLDEIVDLPLGLQVKLLRALEEGEVVPLGESAPVAVDVRIVAATQAPLMEAVRERRFRADLAARIEGLIIRLPPLRRRVEDIPFLASRLLAEHAGTDTSPELDPRFMERLCLYDWPFNVRELDLLVRQLLVLYRGEPILKRGCLPERLRAPAPPTAGPSRPAPGPGPSPTAALTVAERSLRDRSDLAALIAALKTTGGNVMRAAALVGTTRQRAYRLMEQRTYDELQEIRAQVAPADDDDAGAGAGAKRT